MNSATCKECETGLGCACVSNPAGFKESQLIFTQIILREIMGCYF